MINVLTGDRPTGRLHIGHYVGSLRERVKIQDEMKYDNFFIMIADSQALTDNYGNPQKVTENLLEVMIDYLSVGLDPQKVTFFIQSSIAALPELFCYFMNLVKLPRLLRNPTIKNEIKDRGYSEKIGLPVGFVNYPISQAADILGFKATIVPVGEDQLPMLEQAREIAKTFNALYKEIFPMPEPITPKNKVCARLPGIDGSSKMSKSLHNCIYLSDDSKTLKEKVNKMYTDPLHIRIEDPGHIEGNIVFTYLDAFCENRHLEKYLPQYKNLTQIKEHYQRGGLGDSVIKKLLFNILNETLTPFREKRKYYEEHKDLVIDYLKSGTQVANNFINETMREVKKAMGLNYFDGEM